VFASALPPPAEFIVVIPDPEIEEVLPAPFAPPPSPTVIV
jgi:hypothetical protein